MRVIIAGSRGIVDSNLLEEAVLESGFEVDEVVCGGAKGVDEMGLVWAVRNGIPVKMMNADWKAFGKSAGRERNVEMARYASADEGAMIALWDGRSRGTDHMIRVAKMQGLKVYVKKVNKKETRYE